jgi:uncharacterized protein YbaA (DUF1428 family)
MSYVDGFVLPVPKKNLKAYRKMAAEGAKMWMKAGALQYFECAGDDLKVKPMGGMKAVGFLNLAKAKSGETVFFSFIVFKSRAHRDAVNKKVMAAMAKEYGEHMDMPAMPFDMKRMAYGGFKAIVEA